MRDKISEPCKFATALRVNIVSWSAKTTWLKTFKA